MSSCLRVNTRPLIVERSNKEELKTLWSGKVKDFSFPIFDNQAKLVQKRWNNIVTTKKKWIGFLQIFFLRNKEFIIYKKQEKNRNF